MRLANASWLTAAEIAMLALPGLPRTARKVADVATVERWALRTGETGEPLARKRLGEANIVEFHVSVLPEKARARLARDARSAVPAVINVAANQASDLWDWYDRQSEKVKAEAERRLAIIVQIDSLVDAGLLKSVAVHKVATAWGVSDATVWNWLTLIGDVAPNDRLPNLAPRRKGGGIQADIDPDLWQALCSDYLRLSRPSWETCYRRTAALAVERGLDLPHSKTLWRKFEREVPDQLVTLRREGQDKLRRHLPPQIRSVADLHAMELVNIDGHTCDVRVRWPDGTIGRPVLIAIQDVMSRKVLAWRYAASEDALTARLCFADLFERYGIPKGLLADNGRAFASKWLTGGAKTRFRFKIRDEEPAGLLTSLGINIHWALPFRGSSKPVERAFRDFCDAIAKLPDFEGAYTGNSPTNKPANYGERAIDFDVFCRIWDAGIAEHNRRLGRRTEMGGGTLSLDQVFERSYAVAPIGKATPEQLRMALLTADHVRASRHTGAVKVLENSYWSQDLAPVAGQMVTVRFDPEDATKPVHIYDAQGRYVASAPIWERTGFLDAASAKRRGKLEADHRKATKDVEQSLDLLTADRLAAILPREFEDDTPPSPNVIRPVRHRGQTVAALKRSQQAVQAADQPAFIDHFVAGAARLRAVE